MKTKRTGTRLSLFNHKGGVGKTTLTVNIGAALASKGKTVLLVDSDPQCNLTSYLLKDTDVDELLDNSIKPNGRTIWSALRTLNITEGIAPIEPHKTNVKNLFLLPGDIRLSEFEHSLSNLWADCFMRDLDSLKTTNAISLLVNDIARSLKADFIFYDAGPNIGALNRVLLLDCDYFVIPVACDLFSVRGITTLGSTLKNWILDWEAISNLAPNSLSLMLGKPQFLGHIPQQFRVYGQAMAKAPHLYLNKVENRIREGVINILSEVDESLVPKTTNNKLGGVRRFDELVHLAQENGVPFADVIGDGIANKKIAAEKSFEEIANNILSRTGRKI